jgi:polysaccharide export outer membrane protein
VVRPGTVTLDDTPKGLLQAVAASGGFTANASRRRIYLLRDDKSFEIDLAAMLAGRDKAFDPEIQPGDIINVPDQSGDTIFVLGAVNSQKPYPITQDSMPLIRALTEAGGLDSSRANQSGVLVFRMAKTNSNDLRATVFTLDLSRVDGMLLASQFPLRPHDVVYVQTGVLGQYNQAIQNLLPTVSTIYSLLLLRQATRQ